VLLFLASIQSSFSHFLRKSSYVDRVGSTVAQRGVIGSSVARCETCTVSKESVDLQDLERDRTTIKALCVLRDGRALSLLCVGWLTSFSRGSGRLVASMLHCLAATCYCWSWLVPRFWVAVDLM